MTRKWFGGNKGSIMAWSALAMIPLMGMASISVDGARAYMVKSRLSQAVDAAALAGGKTLNTANYNADIVKYFNVNFPTNYLGSTLTGPTITIGEGNDTVTVQAAANVPTTFARLIGTDYVTVSAKATVRRSITGMELALVMDNTGSMRSNGKINAMKNAATAMVN